jgi:hypothetical protein
MINRQLLPAMSLLVVATITHLALGFPEPSKFPVSWQLDFDYKHPQRIVVEVPGSSIPKAYWYMTYTVTNKTKEEREFLPMFTLVTKDGKVIRSDRGVPKAAFDKIKQRTGNKLLEQNVKIADTLRVGEDEARDGVAIWEEPAAEMGSFSVFVSGLSGEYAALNGSDGKPMLNAEGKPVILFKTLQLDYTVSGDEVFPGIDPIDKKHMRWVMR